MQAEEIKIGGNARQPDIDESGGWRRKQRRGNKAKSIAKIAVCFALRSALSANLN